MVKHNLDLAKFPLISTFIKEIENKKAIIDRLNIRKEMSGAGVETLTPFDKNEREILILETDLKLANYHASNIKKQNAIDFQLKVYMNDIPNMNENWLYIIAEAKKAAKRHKAIATHLKAYNENLFETNWESKINWFKNLIKLLNDAGFGLTKFKDVTPGAETEADEPQHVSDDETDTNTDV